MFQRLGDSAELPASFSPKPRFCRTSFRRGAMRRPDAARCDDGFLQLSAHTTLPFILFPEIA
jgi:hypothetical protein